LLNGNNSVLSSSNSTNASKQNEYRNYITTKSILQFLRPKKEQTILDFGCGIGRISYKVSEKVKFVIGTDTSKEMLIRARSENIAKNIEYQDYNTFLESKIQFDSIYTCWVLQHVSNDKLIEIFSIFKSKLKAGGKIILLEQTSNTSIIKNKVLHQRTIEEYKRFLVDFKIEKCENVLRFPSYSMDIWNRGIFPSVFFPLLTMIEKLTVNRKKKEVEYTSTIFVIRRN
jgi:cyclopropane fatty-acyl-phospholipid synthase-like methyltransferase